MCKAEQNLCMLQLTCVYVSLVVNSGSPPGEHCKTLWKANMAMKILSRSKLKPKGNDVFVCLPMGYGKSLIHVQYMPFFLLFLIPSNVRLNVYVSYLKCTLGQNWL